MSYMDSHIEHLQDLVGVLRYHHCLPLGGTRLYHQQKDVVVDLLFNVHGKHRRSCRDGLLT